MLLFPVSLPSHPSAVPYDPRAIVWHPDARQTAQTSSRWLFTALQCPTTTSSHRALPWPTAPQSRPAQAAAGAPDPAVTTQKTRGPAGWAGGTRRPGRERQQHAHGQQSGPAAGPDCRGRGSACVYFIYPQRSRNDEMCTATTTSESWALRQATGMARGAAAGARRAPGRPRGAAGEANCGGE